ncbi:xanthine dehydrogenase small subunit [Comamonas sp. GB3 AK4-5]|uniref:xanthine dehydrogenase small subunit n=1 Tax=Comamonas sp. GB3 AK4-5 TaxID=3231487 RepID=UPI00351E637D
MSTPTIHFLRRGQPVTLHNVPPDRTLLEVLREDLHCSGTKEGCGEGDCGACTVVLGERVATAGQDPQLQLRAINSCIRLAHSVNGLALWTVEDLAHDPHIAHTAGHPLHPAQEALVQCHGSQCGFCTPGFVMSLFGMYENHSRHGEALTRTQAQEALSGNLCRCTGYRPILEAAQQMDQLPTAPLDQLTVLQKLEQLPRLQSHSEGDFSYKAPTDLQELLQFRAAHPQAQLVAGCTDVGLWVTKQHRRFAQVLDVSRVAQLRRIEQQDGALHLGAAATLTDAFAALEAHYPELHRFAARFAGLPVRNSGTLGGNVANGSPIGDSMPLLIALNAQVVLASVRGERSLPLEQLYTGYRQNVMAPDELLVRIHMPLHATQPTVSAQAHWQLLRAYKVSKRQDDDISAVCLVLRVAVQDGLVTEAAIGAGGVAATPVRATLAEDALRGQPWSAATVQAAAAALQAQFKPISDMRASGTYRRQLLASLMTRFWNESQGHPATTLEQITVEVQP